MRPAGRGRCDGAATSFLIALVVAIVAALVAALVAVGLAPTADAGIGPAAAPTSAPGPAPAPAPGEAAAEPSVDVARAAGARTSTMPIPGRGRVRYVAADGDDRNPGTARRPWRTVAHALSQARRGSTIVVYGRHRGHGDGVYREQSWGTIAVPDVTIQAYPGETPRFVGARSIRTSRGAWTKTPAGWSRDLGLDRGDEWEENPYPIGDQIAADAPLADDPRQLFLGPDSEHALALRQVEPADVPLARGEFSVAPVDRTSTGRRTVRVTVGQDPTGQVVEWSTRQLAVRVDPSGHGARIVGVRFERYAPHHGNTLGTVRILAGGVQLIDVAVVQSAATAIAASGENGTLQRPLRRLLLRRVTASSNGASGAAIGDAGREGAAPDVRNDIRVLDSRFERNNVEGFAVGTCGSSCVIAGLKVVRVKGLVVRRSVFADNRGAGVWCDLFCDGLAIAGNRVIANSASGIYVEVSRRADISRNVVARNGRSVSRPSDDPRVGGVKVTGSTEVVVRCNSFTDNRGAQLVLGSDRRDDGPAWHLAGDGDPQVEMRRNLLAATAADGFERSAVAAIGEDDPAAWAGWVRWAGNGAVMDLGPGSPVAAPGHRRWPPPTLPEPRDGEAISLDPTVAAWNVGVAAT